MNNWIFDEFANNRSTLETTPPTDESLTLARELGVQLAETYFTDSSVFGDLALGGIIQTLLGWDDVAMFPRETAIAFADATMDSFNYISSRQTVQDNYGDDLISRLNNLDVAEGEIHV